MPLIKITSDNADDLFKAPEFPVIKAGEHLFIVANQMEIVESSTGKNMLKLQARCQDEDDNKGMIVFEQFLLYADKDVETDKDVTSKKINDAALAQFVCSCGVLTVEQMKAGVEFDIDDLNGRSFKAITSVRNENKYPEELDENNKPIKAPKASIKQYLIPASEEVSA